MRTPPARDVTGGSDERPAARRPAFEPAPDGEALVEHLVDRLARAEQLLRVTQGLVSKADAEHALLARAARILATRGNASLVEIARLALPLLGEWGIVECVVAGTGDRTILAADRAREHACAALSTRAPAGAWATLALDRLSRSGRVERLDAMPNVDHLDPAAALAFHALGDGAVMLVPVHACGELAGALVFGRSRELGPYDARDQQLATELSLLAGLAVEQRRSAAAADDAARAKAEFLTMMSHELRTPLNAIAGYAQLLEMGFRGPLNEAQREAVGRILRGQEHLLELVDAVLTFSRLTSGRLALDTLDLHAHSIMSVASDPVRREFGERGIALDVRGCDEAILVRADHERAPEVIRHLLSNALKFTDRGGRVTLSCEAGEHLVRFIVEDTGRGIPPAQREAIFHPFVQAERGHTRSVDGSGLGLAIARELAERMGGTLGVTSEPGVGSRFVFTLRRAAAAAMDASP